ncbi:hypothetical protein Tco_1184283 [Tanacetum coccineum]
MTTLADKSLLSGGDNKPPMLEKHLYDSWKSIMELYMMNRPHGRMILASVEKGPLVWPTITVDGVTRPKEYTELTPAETIQADCDIKANKTTYTKFTLLLNDMNIYKMPLEQFQVNTKFLNTLPAEWSKFVTDVKLVKDLHTTNVDQIHAHLEQHERHANEVLLMHERNSDPLALVASHQITQSPYQSHQHSYHNSQHQQFVLPYQSSQYGSPFESQQYSINQSPTPHSITYPPNNYQTSVHHNVYSPSSSIPQIEYSPSVNQQSEFSQPDSGLIVPVFQKGDDLIDAINRMMSFLTAVVTSRYPTTNNQLRISSNPRQQVTINDGRIIVQPVQGRQFLCYSCFSVSLSHCGSDALSEVHNHDNVNNNIINQAVQAMPSSEQSNVVNHSETEITSDSNIIPYSQYLIESQQPAVQNSNSSAQQDALILSVIEQLNTQVVNCTKINLDNKSVNDTLTAELERYKEHVKVLNEGQNVDLTSKDNVSDSCHSRDQSAQTVHMLTKPQFFYDHTTKQALGFQNPFYLKKAQQLEPKLYVGDIIEKTNPIVIPDSEETLLLAEESRSKMLLRQKDPIMLEKKVNTTPVDYAALNQLYKDFETRFVPQTELSAEQAFCFLKKLKHHLAGFDVVVKERNHTTAIIRVHGVEHTKACFRDEIIPFVKALKDLFNTFNQYLVDELSEVQNVFHQMEQAVEQHRLESKTFEVKMNQVLNENKRLLEQVLSKDIVNIIMNSSVNNASVNVHECEKCL